METNKSGKTLRKAGLGIAVLVLAAVSLSGCIVADGPRGRGGWNHHHWNNDGGWNHYH
jgi:hypothetical protein